MKKFESMTQGHSKDSHKPQKKQKCFQFFFFFWLMAVPQTSDSWFMTSEYLGIGLPVMNFPLSLPKFKTLIHILQRGGRTVVEPQWGHMDKVQSTSSPPVLSTQPNCDLNAFFASCYFSQRSNSLVPRRNETHYTLCYYKVTLPTAWNRRPIAFSG